MGWPTVTSADPRRHHVTAVLVAHDGAAWLPASLAAVAAQTRAPDVLAAVDTGSTDDSGILLRNALGAGAVLGAPRDIGYGAAVALGLAGTHVASDHGRVHGQLAVEWVWLLHDDCAPEPQALEALLAAADRIPDAAILGPKVRDWGDAPLLLEIGITTDLSGRRETGLERSELDQGQHDDVCDVLAVGTAGALVRRDAWNAVGGLDPALPLFRDDVDLGWRVRLAGHRVVVAPQALVRHVRATTVGLRATSAVSGRPEAVERRHEMYTVLVNVSAPVLVIAVPWLVLSVLLRSVGFLLTRQVRAALDEASACVAVLGTPDRIRHGRRRRRVSRRVSHRQVRPLMARPGLRLRRSIEAVRGALGSGRTGGGTAPEAATESGPTSVDELPGAPPTPFRRLVTRPSVLLVLGLLLVTLLAERALTGGGSLQGGRLLPAPDGARDLWTAYAASWHRVGPGTAADAPPYLAVFATLAGVLFGKPWLALDVLLLGCVPLAGVTAYVATRRIVRSTALRVWAAATYALLPVGSGAIAAGRLDAAVAFVAVPPLLVATGRLLGRDPGRAGWRGAWATGLGLALAAAFAPLLYLLVALVLCGGLAWAVRTGWSVDRVASCRRAAAAGIALAVPVVLLLPWSLQALTHPALPFLGSGRLAADALVAPQPDATALLLLRPGGPGMPPAWTFAALVLAALGGLARSSRRRAALAGWMLVAAGLAAAVLVSRVRVVPLAGGRALPGWPGVPLAVAAAGLLLAALVGADHLRERLRRASFSWQQPAAVVLTVAAAVVPLVAATAWVQRGADGPLTRRPAVLLPSFVRASVAEAPGSRVLVLRPRATGFVDYDLTGVTGPRLGDADLPTSPARRARLSGVVADLAGARGGDAPAALAAYGVRFVLLRSAGTGTDAATTARAIDGQPGLSRQPVDGPVVVWRLSSATSRLSVLSPDVASVARSGRPPPADLLASSPPAALGAGPEGARTQVPPGSAGRLLVLTDAADGGWRARVDGMSLRRTTAWGWAQAFELPAAGGALELARSSTRRHVSLRAQAALLGAVVVLAAPGPRRRAGSPA